MRFNSVRRENYRGEPIKVPVERVLLVHLYGPGPNFSRIPPERPTA